MVYKSIIGATCALFLSLFIISTANIANAGDNMINWETQKLEIQAYAGTVQAIPVHFSLEMPIDNLNVWLTPELRDYVSVSSANLSQLSIESPNEFTLLINVPSGAPNKSIGGTLHLRVQNSTISMPLNIKLSITPTDATYIPEAIALPSPDRLVTDPQTGNTYVEDEILIMMEQGAVVEEIKSLVASIDGMFIGQAPLLGVVQVRVHVTNQTELVQLVNYIESDVRIRYASRHWLHEPQAYPNDPEFDTWSTIPGGNNWGQEFINLPFAWDITTGEQQTKIAVVDSGFDLKHIDFSDNIFSHLGETYNIAQDIFINVDHGTNVAGLIAAQGNNDEGIAGIMWDADLMLYSSGMPSFFGRKIDDLLAANFMNQAIADGARIINFSAGSLFNTVNEAIEASKIFRVVIDQAEWNNKDILFVFAAGNDASDASTFSPAILTKSYTNVISVGAIQPGGDIWYTPASLWFPELLPEIGSNYGDAVDVAAPGKSIYTLSPRSLSGDSQYIYTKGTSIAAPFVTGLAGLLLSTNSSLSSTDLKNIIIESSTLDGYQVPDHEFHVIDAASAVECANRYKTGATSCAPPQPIASFFDDFDDGVIDTSLWEYGGNTVSEINGELRIDVTVTDKGGWARTRNIVIDPSKPVKISRRAKIYAANHYFGGQLTVIVDGYPEHSFGVSYSDYIYTGGGIYCATNGFSIFRNAANPHVCADLVTDVSQLISPIWDTWFDEDIVYDPATGELVYSINGQTEIVYNVGILPAGANTIRISLSAWGWFTGHFQHLDDFSVSQ